MLPSHLYLKSSNSNIGLKFIGTGSVKTDCKTVIAQKKTAIIPVLRNAENSISYNFDGCENFLLQNRQKRERKFEMFSALLRRKKRYSEARINLFSLY